MNDLNPQGFPGMNIRPGMDAGRYHSREWARVNEHWAIPTWFHDLNHLPGQNHGGHRPPYHFCITAQYTVGHMKVLAGGGWGIRLLSRSGFPRFSLAPGKAGFPRILLSRGFPVAFSAP